MANSAAETLAEFKQAATANNAVYATLKVQYTGSWRDDINQISTIVGVPVETLLQLNPWLTSNNFVANNHDYITIKLTAGSPGVGGGSNSQNNVTGFYTTDEWFHPLGVGTWYCTTAFKSSHTGIDLTTGTPGQIQGKPIYAVKAGTVVQSYNSDSWGQTVLIRHDDTTDASGNCYYTRYAHMEAAGPDVGTRVSQGDQVGTVGNTGKSTGYHLHFQIYFTSATRTDYTAFTGSTDFSVNPNSIPDFPGIPYVENKYTQVEAHRSPYVSDADLEIIKGAARGDGSVTESQFDETVNSISNKIIQAKNITPGSDIAQIIHEYIDAQLQGIKGKGLEAIGELVSGESFDAVLNNFCQSVVDNSIWFIENKINNLIDYVIQYGKEQSQTQINSAKSQLKSWIWNTTKVDPNGDLAQSVGSYLDSYIDYVVDNGWNAVRTAITTRDVKGAAQNFVTLIKRQGVDYLCDLGANAAANAITSYIGSHVQSTDNAQIVADLAVGIVNTTIQSIGMVMKGDITIEQAAKNVAVQVVGTVASFVLKQYVTPIVTKWVTNAIVNVVTSIAGAEIAGAIGGAVAGPVGVVVGVLGSLGLKWLANALWG